MPKAVKQQFLEDLAKRFPALRKLGDSQSLYEDPDTSSRIYIRYSKVHPRHRTFFGLRDVDLRLLEGHRSAICLLWDGQPVPLLIPFSAFEDVFASVRPASDGQYKVQVFADPDSTELYVANAGRFNVEAYFGWNELNTPTVGTIREAANQFTHAQIQTLLGAIGFQKGNDVWLPQADRASLDWHIARHYPLHDRLPGIYSSVEPILSEVDVVWMRRGAGELVALFEVEHTTSIYSGLLRFNDVHLTAPQLRPRFSIVSNESRRGPFTRQLNRPTFQQSGLAELCAFMEYDNVLDWHSRLMKESK